MPESLIFLTENSPGVSNDRFGFNATVREVGVPVPCQYSMNRLLLSVLSRLNGL